MLLSWSVLSWTAPINKVILSLLIDPSPLFHFFFSDGKESSDGTLGPHSVLNALTRGIKDSVKAEAGYDHETSC